LAKASSEEGVDLAVHGEFDLWVERPEGAAEAIVIAKEPDGSALYSEVLAKLAALACSRWTPDVRVGILTNKTPDEEPTWFPEAATRGNEEAARRALAWTRDLVRASWTGSFGRAPLSTCRSIGCGYVPFCHPGESMGAACSVATTE
jgi:hypothetical protein